MRGSKSIFCDKYFPKNVTFVEARDNENQILKEYLFKDKINNDDKNLK